MRETTLSDDLGLQADESNIPLAERVSMSRRVRPIRDFNRVVRVMHGSEEKPHCVV